MPHSRTGEDKPVYDRDTRRPVPQHTTSFNSYVNHGQHAQDSGVINDGEPFFGYRDDFRQRSPPLDLHEVFNPPGRDLSPSPHRGIPNHSPPLTGAYPSNSAVRSNSTPVQSAVSSNHPGLTLGPTAMNNTPAISSPSLQPLKTTPGLPIPNSLHDSADVDVFLVRRNGKIDPLYKIIQTEIRYGEDETGVPFSILGFRLERGEDKKRCLQVKLTGTFTQNKRYQKVTVSKLRHVPSKEIKLTEVQVQQNVTGTHQIQVGFNGKPVALVTISGLNSKQTTVTKGQKIVSHFNDSQPEGMFDLILALDDGVEKESDLSVAESVFFLVVLRLEKHRQPMELEFNMDVRYASTQWPSLGSKSKVVSNSCTKPYPGNDFYDIIKN